MASGTITQNPKMYTSGNWTWWELDNGLIVGHFYVPSITANMSQAAGSSFRTTAAVTVETPPFSFRYGSTAILPGGQVVWPVNIATSASGVSCFFVATVSGQRSFSVSGIFVGVK